ncbi:MAG: TRAP transporter large permease subunit [Hydrogenophilus sp.]|nr:TRAP transporter large permease subunit [Hydrogenophilus sp.]
MSELITAHFAPMMFIGLVLLLLSGLPVAFALAATGLFFGFLGISLGLFPETLFQALPLRLFGIMQNETLLAIPFFTLMGLILQRSGMAEELLETAGHLFGPLRGGLAIAVVAVGALLAASTGVVAAAVIAMGLISLPVMLRYGYHRPFAAGVIAASGTLAQIVPPSLVLIVIADQLGRSVGDLYRGALIPSLLLIALYLLLILLIALVRPTWLPAVPPEARHLRTEKGTHGYPSLLWLLAAAAGVALLTGRHYDALRLLLAGHSTPAPLDETIVAATTIGALFTFTVALIDRLLGGRFLSPLAQRIVWAMIPPIILIFLVLGTIFIGIATPTEGGAMGAVGALLIALLKRRLSWEILKTALEGTTKLSIFVLAILLGSTIFSFVFVAADGPHWVKQLFLQLPGEALGFLLVVNLLLFSLGMFLDFFEIAFIVVPLLVPVAEHFGLDLVWFGVMIAINLQTSFLTPPFGFALFYLRSVAPTHPYRDPVTGSLLPAVRTIEIYRGVFFFIPLQLFLVALVVIWPELITAQIQKPPSLNPDAITIPFDETAPSPWNE